MLTTDDAPAFVEHLVREHSSFSGSAYPLARPFPQNMEINPAAVLAYSQQSWTKPLSEQGWERAWSLFHGDKIVGEITLSTSRLIITQLHRAILGIGIEPEFRGNGYGTALLSTALNWARAQHELVWIDLGVFSHNAAARKLYSKFGFIETGRCTDCFRVDGVSVDDIHMTLDLKQI